MKYSEVSGTQKVKLRFYQFINSKGLTMVKGLEILNDIIEGRENKYAQHELIRDLTVSECKLLRVGVKMQAKHEKQSVVIKFSISATSNNRVFYENRNYFAGIKFSGDAPTKVDIQRQRMRDSVVVKDEELVALAPAAVTKQGTVGNALGTMVKSYMDKSGRVDVDAFIDQSEDKAIAEVTKVTSEDSTGCFALKSIKGMLLPPVYKTVRNTKISAEKLLEYSLTKVAKGGTGSKGGYNARIASHIDGVVDLVGNKRTLMENIADMRYVDSDVIVADTTNLQLACGVYKRFAQYRAQKKIERPFIVTYNSKIILKDVDKCVVVEGYKITRIKKSSVIPITTLHTFGLKAHYINFDLPTIQVDTRHPANMVEQAFTDYLSKKQKASKYVGSSQFYVSYYALFSVIKTGEKKGDVIYSSLKSLCLSVRARRGVVVMCSAITGMDIRMLALYTFDLNRHSQYASFTVGSIAKLYPALFQRTIGQYDFTSEKVDVVDVFKEDEIGGYESFSDSYNQTYGVIKEEKEEEEEEEETAKNASESDNEYDQFD